MGISRLMGPILLGSALIGGGIYGIMLDRTSQREHKRNEILSNETHFPENQALLKKTLSVDKYDSVGKMIDNACFSDKTCFYKSWEEVANSLGGITNADSLKKAYYVAIDKLGIGLSRVK